MNSMGVLKVVIDAGHGGHDPGNLGTGRYKDTEKDISLEVALQLGEFIQRAYPNVDVIYTRKEDKFVALKDRTSIANKVNADLFISIHCNSAANHEAYGTETFSMALTKSKANIELAMRENSVIMLEEGYEQTYNGFDPSDPEALIVRSIVQGAYLDQSLSLSAKIQEQYRERVSRRDRGVKQAPYWVISFTTMPSVLTELGFLTNKSEEDFLNSENGKIYMASAIYRAFKQYKAEIEGVEIGMPDFEKDIPDVKVEAAKQEEKEKAENPKAEPELVTYKIQLMASSKKIQLKPDNFGGLEGVEEYEVDGLYKYTIGNVSDYKKAVSLQRTVREKAFPKAFIIAFYKGERIGISDAMEMTRAQN
ncbi:MAG: N-acetylmuramoyl-L-alanine amidase [Salibacteraceae bacterium]|nr:N-acetylmuramoyl-L-alanine amidase [Salibacteraceae bacterium]MDP4687659.1 N-acetylmuramoyl-L-alanine amidase [Salibacteraceae bacterium]MDP4763712.1 N-acetylmuramoyl-L-alanine amidase [Salibacteraceae bacterium]MDP4933933.1 N-acetylmuramoyl-L-alanine amidase [Salibacteraceae bacterium]MDP4965596.1 N-acetylmuramoyl-L-alanine amidase [Salibacteraceae bacterium]